MLAMLIGLAIGSAELLQDGQYLPKVTARGAVELPIHDVTTSSHFEPNWTFEGSGWSPSPTNFKGTPAAKLSGIGEAIVGVGPGVAKCKPFRVTADTKCVEFGLVGSGEISSTSASLTIDGTPAFQIAPASVNSVQLVHWDLTKYEGRMAQLYLRVNGGWIALTPSAAVANANVSPYHLERRFVQTVRAKLVTTCGSADTLDGVMRAYAPIPPELPTQSLRSCTLASPQGPGIRCDRVEDVNNPHQQYLRLEIPVNRSTFASACKFEMTYVIDLYEVALRQGSGPTMVRLAKPDGTAISESAFVQPSYLADFKSPEFTGWLQGQGLVKQDSESNLQFGFRAFQFVAQHFRGAGATDWPSRRASVLCQSMKGDCGSTTILFASICQANNVPCVVQPGRWALNEATSGDMGQFHVMCSVFDPSVGLVPVDPTFAVGAFTNGDNFKIWYGKNEGKFISFGTGSVFAPEKDTDAYLGQFLIIHHIGGTTPFKPQWEDHWTVEKL